MCAVENVEGIALDKTPSKSYFALIILKKHK